MACIDKHDYLCELVAQIKWEIISLGGAVLVQRFSAISAIVPIAVVVGLEVVRLLVVDRVVVRVIELAACVYHRSDSDGLEVHPDDVGDDVGHGASWADTDRVGSFAAAAAVAAAVK